MDGKSTMMSLSHYSRDVHTTVIVIAVVVVVVPFRNSNGVQPAYDLLHWEYTNHSMLVVLHTMMVVSLSCWWWY